MSVKMDNGIPIFPAGVLKIYQNPNPPIIPDIDDFDYTNAIVLPESTPDILNDNELQEYMKENIQI